MYDIIDVTQARPYVPPKRWQKTPMKDLQVGQGFIIPASDITDGGNSLRVTANRYGRRWDVKFRVSKLASGDFQVSRVA